MKSENPLLLSSQKRADPRVPKSINPGNGIIQPKEMVTNEHERKEERTTQTGSERHISAIELPDSPDKDYDSRP